MKFLRSLLETERQKRLKKKLLRIKRNRVKRDLSKFEDPLDSDFVGHTDDGPTWTQSNR